jgi:hypothetical protein
MFSQRRRGEHSHAEKSGGQGVFATQSSTADDEISTRSREEREEER